MSCLRRLYAHARSQEDRSNTTTQETHVPAYSLLYGIAGRAGGVGKEGGGEKSVPTFEMERSLTSNREAGGLRLHTLVRSMAASSRSPQSGQSVGISA